MQVLLISPHPEEAKVFQVILQHTGFIVRTLRSLDQAVETWPENPADLVLIALSENPEMALKQVRQIRAHTVVPIIVILDLPSDDLQVCFLEAGVDLVLGRPFSMRVLVAQIRAVLSRGAGIPFRALPTLSRKDLSLDPSKRTVRVGEGETKRLTRLEFRLLYTLMTHARQIIPAETIVEHVWGYSGGGNRELVRGLVQRLRSKVESDPHNPVYILTEPGIGYTFIR